MFFFCIPFRSKRASSDWKRATWLLSNTVRSILGQTAADFRILVACHETPEIEHGSDPRLSLHHVEQRFPLTLQGMRADTMLKRRLLATVVRDAGGGYLMRVDADDLVHRGLVDYVQNNPHDNGYIIRHGYEFDCHRGTVYSCNYFNLTCGTCSIVNYAPDDLPRTLDEEEDCRYLHFGGHHMWRSGAQADPRPLAPLPFHGAMYVLNHGENLSDQYVKYGRRQLIARRLFGRRPVQDQIKDFSLQPYLDCRPGELAREGEIGSEAVLRLIRDLLHREPPAKFRPVHRHHDGSDTGAEQLVER